MRIGGNNLETEGVLRNVREASFPEDVLTVFDEHLSGGEDAMMFMPVLDVAMDGGAAQRPTEVMMVVASGKERPKDTSRLRRLGVCLPVSNSERVGSSQRIDPATHASVDLFEREPSLQQLSKDARRELLGRWSERARVTFLETPRPKFGQLVLEATDRLAHPSRPGVRFYKVGKVGETRADQAAARVEIGGYKIDLIYAIKPIHSGLPYLAIPRLCGKKGQVYPIGQSVENGLFGNGTQTGSIVNGVIIGGSHGEQETHPDIRYALSKLGFRIGNNTLLATAPAAGSQAQPSPNTLPSVGSAGAHADHFHIYLQRPGLQAIQSANNLNAQAVPKPLVERPITDSMLRDFVRMRAGEKCAPTENQNVPNNTGLPGGAIHADTSVAAFLSSRHKVVVRGKVQTFIDSPPKHGRIVSNGWYSDPSFPLAEFEGLTYIPKDQFLGKETLNLRVIVNGRTFKVTLTVMVRRHFDDAKDDCRPYDPFYYRDSSSAREVQFALESASEIVHADAPGFTTWPTKIAYGESALARILNEAVSLTSTGYASKAAAALATTVGTGASATITLSPDAAGHGWFVDQTPESNDEFLPTADPTVLIAKEGSDAAGRMDMLSVLLHQRS
jgi:hypothetical protein